MAGRVIRALVRRAGEGDAEALEELLKLSELLPAAIKDAGVAMHAFGYTFTELADIAGVSRQAARERFSDRLPVADEPKPFPWDEQPKVAAGQPQPKVAAGETLPAAVTRVDRYTITVEGAPIRATVDQERRIAAMDSAERDRFLKIMGARP